MYLCILFPSAKLASQYDGVSSFGTICQLNSESASSTSALIRGIASKTFVEMVSFAPNFEAFAPLGLFVPPTCRAMPGMPPVIFLCGCHSYAQTFYTRKVWSCVHISTAVRMASACSLDNVTDVGAAAVYSSSAASQQQGNTICSTLHVPSRACMVLDALPVHCFNAFFCRQHPSFKDAGPLS